MIAVCRVQIAKRREECRCAMHDIVCPITVPSPIERDRNIRLLARKYLGGFLQRFATIPQAGRFRVSRIRNCVITEIAADK